MDREEDLPTEKENEPREESHRGSNRVPRSGYRQRRGEGSDDERERGKDHERLKIPEGIQEPGFVSYKPRNNLSYFPHGSGIIAPLLQSLPGCPEAGHQ